MSTLRATWSKPLPFLVALSAAALLQPALARAETVLRVAMTAGDLPDWTGQPDQGLEGYRLVGWSPYDALLNWDLPHSDRQAQMVPGLATKRSSDPANNKAW